MPWMVFCLLFPSLVCSFPLLPSLPITHRSRMFPIIFFTNISFRILRQILFSQLLLRDCYDYGIISILFPYLLFWCHLCTWVEENRKLKRRWKADACLDFEFRMCAMYPYDSDMTWEGVGENQSTCGRHRSAYHVFLMAVRRDRRENVNKKIRDDTNSSICWMFFSPYHEICYLMWQLWGEEVSCNIFANIC